MDNRLLDEDGKWRGARARRRLEALATVQTEDKAEPATRRRKPWRPGAVVLSASAHALLLFMLVMPLTHPPKLISPEPMVISMVDGALLSPAPGPPAAAAAQSVAPPIPTPAKPIPRRASTRPAPLAASKEPPEEDGDAAKINVLSEISDGELVGAATAANSGTGGGGGDGGGGRNCNMVQFLQDALRRDSDVQAAAHNAHRAPGATGKAILLWNGDWIKRSDQDGNGLAGVREALMAEILFAPATCRNQTMRGLVLISFSDAPGAPRVAFGTGSWRWSDLLMPPHMRNRTLSQR